MLTRRSVRNVVTSLCDCRVSWSIAAVQDDLLRSGKLAMLRGREKVKEKRWSVDRDSQRATVLEFQESNSIKQIQKIILFYESAESAMFIFDFIQFPNACFKVKYV